MTLPWGGSSLGLRRALCLCVVLASCGDEPAGAAPGPAAPTQETSMGAPRLPATDAPLRFNGVGGILAGEDWIELVWDPARDADGAVVEATYRVYTAAEPGMQDYTRPALTTRERRTRMVELRPGHPVYAVVRAADATGAEDPNRVEWCATPNPVRFVDASAAGSLRDGRTPATAFASVHETVEDSIAMEGVNIHVAAGTYAQRTFLFGGMSVYGGFEPGFREGRRDLVLFATVLRSDAGADLVRVAPGRRPCGLDGVVLDGGGGVQRGIVGDDCKLHVTRCEIRGFRRRGVHLRSQDEADSRVRGVFRDTVLRDNLGEGLSVEGVADLDVTGCSIASNAQEGIECKPLAVPDGGRVAIVVRRCRIVGNGDQGIDLELTGHEGARGSGGRVEVVVRDCLLAGNGNDGIEVGLSHSSDIGTGLRVTIASNRIAANGHAGIHLDGDDGGLFRVLGNTVVGNRGRAGIQLSGDSPHPIYLLAGNRVFANHGAGVLGPSAGTVFVRYGSMLHNGGAAVTTRGGWMSLHGCLLAFHQQPFDAQRVAWCLLHEDAWVRASGAAELVSGAPALARWPEQVAFLSAPSQGDVLPLADPGRFAVGSVVELEDDGAARRVSAVMPQGLRVEPAPGRSLPAGTALFGWGSSGPVEEDDTPSADSPLVNAGDPIERDPDGSLPDIGPRGGPAPAGWREGDLAQVELVAVDPPPGSVVSEARWVLRFLGGLGPVPRARVLPPGGGPIELKARLLGDGSVQWTWPRPPAAGTPFTLELLPHRPGGGRPQQPWHLSMGYVMGAPLPAGGGAVPGLPAVGEGRLEAPGDVHRFTLELAGSSSLRARLLADHPPDGADLVLSLRDGEGTLLQQGRLSQADPRGRIETASRQLPPDGKLMVEVARTGEALSTPLKYRLVLWADG